MSAFFEIVGMVVVGFVLFASVAGLTLLFVFRKKLLAGLREIIAATAGMPPRRVTLRADDALEWSSRKLVAARRAEFEALGFESVGDFDVVELCGVLLVGLVDSSRGLLGVVYDHPEVGVYCDVAVRFEDGTTLTLTSSPSYGQLDPMPGHPKIVEPGEPPSALVARLEAEAGGRVRLPVAAGEFRADFERAYAEETDWRNARGGPNEAEVARIAENMDEDVKPEDIARLRETWQEVAAEQLAESCLEQFTHETLLSVSDWEKVRESVIVIHDGHDSARVIDEFSSWMEVPPEIAEDVHGLEPAGTPPRELFAQLNQRLPEPMRYRRLGQVSEPANADIWTPST